MVEKHVFLSCVEKKTIKLKWAAVLSFVGGKNIVVPSERATQPEAEGICAKQGLELMSLDSLTQMDSVQDFLGDIGAKLNFAIIN